MRRALPLVLLASLPLRAGQVLTFTEQGTRGATPYRSTLRLFVSPAGVRAEASEGGAGPVVYLWLAAEDRILPVDPPTGPVVSAGTTAAVEARARASGNALRPGAFTATALGARQSFGAFTCESWALRRPGQTTEIVCLADPKAAGVEEATREALRRMNARFVPFLNAARLAGGDTREAFNAYALDGFPVRTFRSKDGVVELDAQLVSVETRDLDPALFAPPALPEPPPAPTPAPRPTPAAAPDATMPLAGWQLRGMPDPSRVWTGADYDAAAGLFETVAREDAARLPRERSDVSAPLFRRLVDPANLAALSGGAPLEDRAKDGALLLAGVDRASVVWAGAYRDDASRGGELAALMAFTLRAAREVVPLADAAVAKAPKKDPMRKARAESRARAHAALAAVVNGALAALAAPGGFVPPDRARLARAVADDVPPLRAYLPANDRQALAARLGKLAAAEKDPAVREALLRAKAAVARPAKAA